jgi:putative membrane protein
MKKKSMLNAVSILALIVSMTACGSKQQDSLKDPASVEVANEANDSTFTDRKEEKDADFIVNAVAGNYAAIKIAQLANNKSVDKKVKDMAAQLEKNHTEILKGLKAYADKHGIAVPLEEGPSDAKEMKNLEGKSVDKFDEAWTTAMEERHEKSINNFEARRDRTRDPELKEWITATLPGLKEHLEMLKTHEQGEATK